ncbi:hypothetical protein CYLTODRAFT_98458 [Cylindrobasidium torrendii FP15055 ss-10]|uniref:Uncharacterized protein n=1 Tax=Cylindrobasidium torrendii FP15055 ss-10 TaxID=1314674 RepID=A0A0D7BMP1_9AGAR|nr:hypothetical protein CYLTODRAFT_98458 [Cylindrobasidium torrendii FP15055 ss-10]
MTEELEALRVRIAELESPVRRRKDVKGKGKAREVIPSPPLHQPIAIGPFSLQAGGGLHYDSNSNPLPTPPEDVTLHRTAFYPYTETGMVNNDPAIYGTRTIRQHVIPPMTTDSGAPGIIIKKERHRDPKERKHRKKHRETYDVAPVAGPSEPRMAVQLEVDRSLQRASPVPGSVPTAAVRAESPNTRRANFTPLSSRGSIATWNDNGSINVNFSSNSRLSLNSLGVDGLAHFQTEPLPIQTSLDVEPSPLLGSSDGRRRHTAPEDGLEISVGDPRAFLPVIAPALTTSADRTPTQPRARLTSRATAPAAPSFFHGSAPSSHVEPSGSLPPSLHPAPVPQPTVWIPEVPGHTHSHSSSRVSAPSRSSRRRSHEPQVNWGPHIYAAAPPTSRNNALGLEVTAQAPVVVAPTPNMPSGARHFLRSFSHAT